MLFLTAIFFGFPVGFALRAIGGGGSIVAVPVLVYALGMAPHRAICVSMFAIGLTATVGAIEKLRTGEADATAGWTLALPGMLGASLAATASKHVSQRWLLVLFAAVMVFVATRMFIESLPRRNAVAAEGSDCRSLASASHWRRIGILFTGLLIGALSGMLGVGAGFMVIPALMLGGGLPFHRAMATSLQVVAFISISAFASHFLAGQRPPLGITALFSITSVLGSECGARFGNHLLGPRFQQVVAIAIMAFAAFILARNLG